MPLLWRPAPLVSTRASGLPGGPNAAGGKTAGRVALGLVYPAAMDAEQSLRRVTRAAVGTALTLAALKAAAYFATGSIGVAASLVDSLLDTVASGVNLWAVHVALKPADKDHRFGHGKAEPLAGLAQSAFVLGSALFLVLQAIDDLIAPSPVEHGAVGLAVMVISTVATLGLVAYQRRVIKQTSSLAITADSLHYTGDILTNAAVIAGILIATETSFMRADPIIGIGVAVVLMVSAWKILRQSIDQLMDKELADDARARILALTREDPMVLDVHDLKTRASGRTTFVQLHATFDRDLPLVAAHDAGERIVARIRGEFPDAEVTVHHDPSDAPRALGQ